MFTIVRKALFTYLKLVVLCFYDRCKHLNLWIVCQDVQLFALSLNVSPAGYINVRKRPL